MPLSANLSAAPATAAMSLLAMTALLRPLAGGVVNNFGEGVREGEKEGTVLKENNTINVDKPGKSSRDTLSLHKVSSSLFIKAGPWFTRFTLPFRYLAVRPDQIRKSTPPA